MNSSADRIASPPNHSAYSPSQAPTVPNLSFFPVDAILIIAQNPIIETNL
jgi:hypothetical protein